MTRSLAMLLLLLVPFGCKDPTGTHVADLYVGWMEWLPEVEASQPVKVHIAGTMACGAEYVRRYEVDGSTILFNPYAIVPRQQCQSLVPVTFGETISFIGLAPGTYKLQSGDRVFGEVVVTAGQIDRSALIAAGQAWAVRDPDGCLRVRPLAVYPRWPLENAADTASQWVSRFVTGELIDLPAPVCGSVTAFRLVSRE